MERCRASSPASRRNSQLLLPVSRVDRRRDPHWENGDRSFTASPSGSIQRRSVRNRPACSRSCFAAFRQTAARQSSSRDTRRVKERRRALSRGVWSALMPSCLSRRAAQHSTKAIAFPPETISRCVWLYYRFGVSLRDVSELMLARGIEVSHEAIRLWTLRFGAEYARRLKHKQGRCSDIWHLDELCLVIGGRRGWLWRAVDDAGEVLDVLVQRRRNAHAAKRFLRKLLKGLRLVPGAS